MEKVETFSNIRYLEIRVSEVRILGRITYETKPVHIQAHFGEIPHWASTPRRVGEEMR